MISFTYRVLKVSEMKNKKILIVLVILISVLSAIATSSGIFSAGGQGEYEYKSIRGESVTIYGKGLYKDMSADVAIQGIAKDYITLFTGVPLLLVSLYLFNKNSEKGLFLISGTAAYFLVTYLFYTAMAMYNNMFLIYAALVGLSFFSFILTLFSYNPDNLINTFQSKKVMKYTGIFLIIVSLMIALLWLNVILPPMFEGKFPKELQHYTTLIVQGFDLGLFLPLTFVTGFLAIRRNKYGFMFTPVYIIFLSLLMIALSSKVFFMAGAGINVIPAIIIIPVITLISILFSFLLLKEIR